MDPPPRATLSLPQHADVSPPRPRASESFTHLTADFIGALPSQLRDGRLISGLLIAAAGAAGFTTIGAPVVRALPDDGLGVLLMLDTCHMSAHAFPERGVLLLDILTASTQDPRKALDVFTRRLTAREIRSEQRVRG